MEINHDISLQEIYIPAKHSKDNYLCENFVVYPNEKEKKGGYLLGIVELRATPQAESKKIINTIIKTLEEKFYDQINASPDPQKLNIETIFEHALQKTNNALLNLIEIGHVNFSLNNLNYIIAVAKPVPKTKEIDIYFAHQGMINAFLLHKTKQSNYKVINIIDNTTKRENKETDKIKIFSSILSGRIYYNDTMVFSSEIFSNYIPPHKVNTVLSNNALPAAIDYFKNLINNVKNNSHLTYASLFIKMEEKRAINEKPVSQKSIAKLMTTKENTEKYLTPTFALNISDNIKKAAKFVTPKRKEQYLQPPTTQGKVKFGIIKYIGNIFGIIFSKIRGLFSRKKEITTKESKTPIIEKKASKFKFAKSRKVIIVIVVVLIIIFAQSIFWINHRKNIKIQQEEYAEDIKQIREDINNAQVNLIYKNESKSLELIQTALNSTEQLPKESQNEQANYSELTDQINTIRNKLLHIEKVIPVLVAETPNEDDAKLKTVFTAGDSAIISGGNNSLYAIDTVNKKITDTLNSPSGEINSGTSYDSTSLFLTNQSKLIQYKDNSVTQRSIEWDNVNAQAISLYNNRLYVLDQANKKIFKFTGSGTSYTGKSEWIEEMGSGDLSNATDLTVDGSIWVLTKDGQVYKYHAGDYEDFTISTVEPKMQDAKQLITTANFSNIYILDSQSKRIIVINKDGKLQKQLLFETVEGNINGIHVSTDEKNIFFVTDTKLYKATIN